MVKKTRLKKRRRKKPKTIGRFHIGGSVKKLDPAVVIAKDNPEVKKAWEEVMAAANDNLNYMVPMLKYRDTLKSAAIEESEKTRRKHQKPEIDKLRTKLEEDIEIEKLRTNLEEDIANVGVPPTSSEEKDRKAREEIERDDFKKTMEKMRETGPGDFPKGNQNVINGGSKKKDRTRIKTRKTRTQFTAVCIINK